MDCPRCQRALAETRQGWLCPDGHGRFVPAEMMAQKVRATRVLAKADSTVPSTACPACGQTMTLYHPKGIDVDVCSCGGIWLDAGEEKLLHELAGKGLAAWATFDILSLLGSLLG